MIVLETCKANKVFLQDKSRNKNKLINTNQLKIQVKVLMAKLNYLKLKFLEELFIMQLKYAKKVF